MRAVILAAGRGSRLGAATDALPKCLVEVAGRPLIAHQWAALREAGIDDVCVVTGYRAELVESRGVETRHNEAWERTNMVASLLCAADFITDATIVSYSDIVYPPSFVVALASAPSCAPITIAFDPQWLDLWQRRFDDPLADAETFRLDGQRVVEIGGRAADLGEIEGQYIGLLRLTPDAIPLFRSCLATEGPTIDCTGALRSLIRAGVDVRAVPVTGSWFEIDSRSDLDLAEQVLGARAGAAW